MTKVQLKKLTDKGKALEIMFDSMKVYTCFRLVMKKEKKEFVVLRRK